MNCIDEVGRWQATTIAPQKSSVTLFTSDTHQSRLNPQVRIGDAVALLNRTPKILGVTLDTHFTFGPHARPAIVSSGPQVPSISLKP